MVNAGPADDDARGAKTLDNGLRVLEAVAGSGAQGLAVTELAARLGLHRTVVYRLLITLRAHRLIQQSADGRYRTGLGLAELAGTVHTGLRAAAQAPLRALAEATGATAHLTVLDGDEALSLLVVEPVNAVAHVAYRTGSRHSLDRGAAGLAILIGRPPVRGERREITRGRRTGYVATTGEIQTGAWGLSAPVPAADGHATTSVGIVALQAMTEVDVAARVLHAAAEIAASA